MIRIIFVGRVKEKWLKEACDEYVKRTSKFVRVQVDEVKDEKIMGKDAEAIKKKEGERILNLIKDDFVIGLDVEGESLGSETFARALNKAGEQSKRITFVVGGALGLSREVLKRCNMKMSLSRMTFTNQMVRLLLIEQIYRAFMIMAGREYHK
ncbi:23S rRNA (pseudouridine(1915)-N(3))-methyltransferase RlmH [Candidatus Woesearchaeota archaeon]|nr:23S rRNA (pseudouridine(1915)-N(3))-methyltransferase RlmH [Candidatus Woesearchaeota archaeon]